MLQGLENKKFNFLGGKLDSHNIIIGLKEYDEAIKATKEEEADYAHKRKRRLVINKAKKEGKDPKEALKEAKEKTKSTKAKKTTKKSKSKSKSKPKSKSKSKRKC